MINTTTDYYQIRIVKTFDRITRCKYKKVAQTIVIEFQLFDETLMQYPVTIELIVLNLFLKHPDVTTVLFTKSR